MDFDIVVGKRLFLSWLIFGGASLARLSLFVLLTRVRVVVVTLALLNEALFGVFL